jgi:hypothetical protein
MGICHEAYILAVKDSGLLEAPGGADNPRIVLMHQCTTLRATEDRIPWCSSAMNYWISLANIKRNPRLAEDMLIENSVDMASRKLMFKAVGIDINGTRMNKSLQKLVEPTWSAAAASWLKWGQSSIGGPIEGDIVVLGREGGNHVGFFVDFDKKGRIVCFGGNQQDKVCEAAFSKDRLLDFRRA